MLLIGARGLRALTQDSSFDNKAMMYRGRAIRLLNDALSDPGKATSDGAIAALLCLSFDEVCNLFSWKSTCEVRGFQKLNISIV